ncbi:MAG: winged helix-turn-helix transcriptional regulator [Gammaproteobacteria bacterium]|nr:winged helix-turn-helix transcriptional regulator [Gammaproteobacteria bacterium]MCP5199798.1 winged helix-turn-helix transcriptional regulator [Gammaproteobacteria bacterium]
MPRNSTIVVHDERTVARAARQLERDADVVPRMTELYKLIANPVRVKILLILGRVGRLCVGDIASLLDLSFAATSQQLKQLKDRGWLATTSEGKQVYYTLTNRELHEALEGDLRMLRKGKR